MRRFVTKVLDQGSTNSCVANMVASAIDILESRAGLEYVAPSRLFMYYNARRFHSRILLDTGTYMRTCVKGLFKFGVPDESKWPFSTNPLKVNRRLGWEPYMLGQPRKGGEYYTIFETGDDRIKAIKAALSQGYPVGFGTKINRKFMKASGPYVEDHPKSDEEIVGGHAMLVVGYKETDAYGLIFEVLNSWGMGYKQEGFVWLTERYLRWSDTRDLYVIRGWDRIKEAAS